MAKRSKKSGEVTKTKTRTKTLKASSNPLAEIDDGMRKDFQRPSNELIYDSMMRGGGEPFGRPFSSGISSLTDAVVKYFKQKSFFGFEVLEKPRRRRNKFTRYGAAVYHGEYDLKAAKRAERDRTIAAEKAKKRKKGWF